MDLTASLKAYRELLDLSGSFSGSRGDDLRDTIADMEDNLVRLARMQQEALTVQVARAEESLRNASSSTTGANGANLFTTSGVATEKSTAYMTSPLRRKLAVGDLEHGQNPDHVQSKTEIQSMEPGPFEESKVAELFGSRCATEQELVKISTRTLPVLTNKAGWTKFEVKVVAQLKLWGLGPALIKADTRESAQSTLFGLLELAISESEFYDTGSDIPVESEQDIAVKGAMFFETLCAQMRSLDTTNQCYLTRRDRRALFLRAGSSIQDLDKFMSIYKTLTDRLKNKYGDHFTDMDHLVFYREHMSPTLKWAADVQFSAQRRMIKTWGSVEQVVQEIRDGWTLVVEAAAYKSEHRMPGTPKERAQGAGLAPPEHTPPLNGVGGGGGGGNGAGGGSGIAKTWEQQLKEKYAKQICFPHLRGQLDTEEGDGCNYPRCSRQHLDAKNLSTAQIADAKAKYITRTTATRTNKANAVANALVRKQNVLPTTPAESPTTPTVEEERDISFEEMNGFVPTDQVARSVRLRAFKTDPRLDDIALRIDGQATISCGPPSVYFTVTKTRDVHQEIQVADNNCVVCTEEDDGYFLAKDSKGLLVCLQVRNRLRMPAGSPNLIGEPRIIAAGTFGIDHDDQNGPPGLFTTGHLIQYDYQNGCNFIHLVSKVEIGTQALVDTTLLLACAENISKRQPWQRVDFSRPDVPQSSYRTWAAELDAFVQAQFGEELTSFFSFNYKTNKEGTVLCTVSDVHRANLMPPTQGLGSDVFEARAAASQKALRFLRNSVTAAAPSVDEIEEVNDREALWFLHQHGHNPMTTPSLDTATSELARATPDQAVENVRRSMATQWSSAVEDTSRLRVLATNASRSSMDGNLGFHNRRSQIIPLAEATVQQILTGFDGVRVTDAEVAKAVDFGRLTERHCVRAIIDKGIPATDAMVALVMQQYFKRPQGSVHAMTSAVETVQRVKVKEATRHARYHWARHVSDYPDTKRSITSFGRQVGELSVDGGGSSSMAEVYDGSINDTEGYDGSINDNAFPTRAADQSPPPWYIPDVIPLASAPVISEALDLGELSWAGVEDEFNERTVDEYLESDEAWTGGWVDRDFDSFGALPDADAGEDERKSSVDSPGI
jgi:hypothetical protein